MFNQEHVALLLQGAAAWNSWRTEHPESRPDLRGGSLVEAGFAIPNSA